MFTGKLRAVEFAIFALLGLFFISYIAPQQLPVALYKATLVLIGGFVGYWADRWLFPYARPDQMGNSPFFSSSMIRRAVIVAACILGLTLGL